MNVAYSILNEKPDQVKIYFELFNEEFREVCEAFKKVTKQEFKPGQKIIPVRQYSLSDEEKIDLQQFLERHQLQDLLQILLEEGVTLTILLDMTDDNMKEVGIKKYGRKKQLLEAIRMEDHGRLPDQPFEEHTPVEEQTPVQDQTPVKSLEPMGEWKHGLFDCLNPCNLISIVQYLYFRL